ncbi:MAG: CoA transferase, partial [Dehalococcoidia bacterium]
MSGPLDGVRVVELAIFIAGPSIGMLLADWGAEVIKIEAPEGDPWRYQTLGKPAPGLEAPVFELDNRGKRSVILDLRQQSDRERAVALIGSADVFLTNLRQQALERMRLDAASMRSHYPSLIVLQVSGYGLHGPDAEKPGYDITAFWARSG